MAVTLSVVSAVRGPVDESIRSRPDVRHNMEQYRSDHPACEWCGKTKDVQVHHVQSLWLAPELAADTNNYVSLCGTPGGGCHLRVGHAGNFGTRCVTNVKEMCRQRIVVERRE